MQPILPVATMSGSVRANVGGLALAQRFRHLGLQQVVGAGRAAAEMPLRHVDHLEAGGAQQRARLLDDLLHVLHRAGVMIGDAIGRHAGGAACRANGPKEFADIARQRRDLGGRPRHAGHRARTDGRSPSPSCRIRRH